MQESQENKNDFLSDQSNSGDNKLIPKLSESKFDGVRINKYTPWILVTLVIVVALGAAFWQYRKVSSLNKELADLKQNPQQINEDITKTVVEKVGKLIILPEGEQPTLATVTDPSKLQNQPFFSKAQLGDRVLIYSVAKKAILYDEKNNKIREVAPINTNNNIDGSNGTTQQSP